MRWPIVSLAALAIATVASVFAIWPVVGHAPWQSSPPAIDPFRLERCRAALGVQSDLRARFGLVPARPGSRVSVAMAQAVADVQRYC